jgi:hypothetical protein
VAGLQIGGVDGVGWQAWMICKGPTVSYLHLQTDVKILFENEY